MKYVNFCLVAIASLVLMSGSVKTDKISIGYYPGEELPNISFNDLEGRNFNLHGYKGKKVVVNFWAAYDAQSRAANVRLHNFLIKNRPEIEFVSICFDENESVFKKTVLLDKLGEYSQFCDVKGTRSEIYKEFQLNKGFKSYLIDEKGVIAAMNVTPEKLEIII